MTNAMLKAVARRHALIDTYITLAICQLTPIATKYKFAYESNSIPCNNYFSNKRF